jgi:pyruvate ferredoxin oxidoreductase alpha subunit
MSERAHGERETSRGDLRALIVGAEALVSETIVSTEGTAGEPVAATPAEAVQAAADLARQGRRASVIIAPHELFGALGAIHAAARARAPFTVHVVKGASTSNAAGRDEIAPALELGAGVLATWSAQDGIDVTLAARRAAEDSETPWIIFSDGGGKAVLPDAALVARFLGDVEAKSRSAPAPHDPVASKRAERSFASRAPFALASALRELGELTSRPLPPVERFETADAEEVIVASGEAFATVRAVALARRQQGQRVGAVGIRALRPFFAAEAVKAVARARAIAVIEPLDVALAPSGPLAGSLKAAFADALTWASGFPGVGRIPPIISAVFATLDSEGGGVRPEQVQEILDELATGDRARRVLVFGSDHRQ